MIGTNGFRLSERAMGMTDAAWARHANPWSGWTRVTILPLLAAAVWSRVWLGWWCLFPLAVVLLWTWANPRVFPPPVRRDAWMTRGVIGERIWLTRQGDPALGHHRPVVRALMAVIAVGMLLLAVGLALLDPVLTVAGLTGAMLGKLWFLDRMAWVERDSNGEG